MTQWPNKLRRPISIKVARIVGSYVRHHQITPDELIGLIVEVHGALAGLGRAPPAQEPLSRLRKKSRFWKNGHETGSQWEPRSN